MDLSKKHSHIKKEILDFINNEVKILDTHEHLYNNHDFSHGLIDFVLSSPLIKEDLWSSGLDVYTLKKKSNEIYPRLSLNTEKIDQYRNNPEKSFELLENFFLSIVNTSYFQFTMRSFKDLYGFTNETINRKNCNAESIRVTLILFD